MDNGEVGTRHFKQRGWNYDEWCLFLIGVKNIAGWILLIYANDKTKYRNFEKGKLLGYFATPTLYKSSLGPSADHLGTPCGPQVKPLCSKATAN